MAGGGRRVVVVVVSWCFEPVVSLVRNPRNWGVSLRARTTDSDSLLVPLRRSLSLKGVDAMRRIRDRVAGLDVHRDSVVACVELFEIGRAHVGTPVTNAHLLSRLLHKKKTNTVSNIY